MYCIIFYSLCQKLLSLVLSSPSAPHALSCSPTSKQTTAGSRHAFSPPRRTASTCLSGILFVASARTRSSSCLSTTQISRPSSGAASLYLPLPHIQSFCIFPSLIFSGWFLPCWSTEAQNIFNCYWNGNLVEGSHPWLFKSVKSVFICRWLYWYWSMQV